MRFTRYTVWWIGALSWTAALGQTGGFLGNNPGALREALTAARVEAGGKLAEQILDLTLPGEPGTTTAPSEPQSQPQSQPRARRLGDEPNIRRIEPALREYCLGAPERGKARVYLDGTAEVDLEANGKEVQKTLGLLLEPFLAGLATSKPAGRDANLAAEVAALEFPPAFYAVGVGRPEQMRGTPVPAVAGQTQAPEIPAGWAGVSGTGRMLAARSAASDAQMRMLHQVLNLKTDGGKPLAEVLEAGGRRTVEQWLVNRGAEGTVYNPSGVASTRMIVRQEELVMTLGKIRTKQGQAIKLHAPPGELAALGYAFAPAGEVSATQPVGIGRKTSLPEWAKKKIRTTAQSDLTEAQLHDAANQSLGGYQARINGLMQLLDEAGRIQVAPGATFNDILAAYPNAQKDINTHLSAARMMEEKKLPNGQTEATLELDLGRVGLITQFYGVPQPKR